MRLSRTRAGARVLAGVLALLAPILAGCSERGQSTVRNVVLITLDTTRADYLSSYGYPQGTSPHLDDLARRGTRFDLAISTAAVTPVSHASILTGRFNHEHGLRVLSAAGGFRLGAEIPTLATVLQDRGFSTLAVHSAFPVSAHFGLDRGFAVFESFDATIKVKNEGREQHSWGMSQFQRRSDATTQIVLDQLAVTNEPFFLWVHLWDPHDRLQLPPEDFEGVQTEGEPRHRATYAREVQYMDSQIGRLLADLEERGLADSTMIAVVSDHGEGLGDHGWLHHRILFQEQIRVPMILAIPGSDQVPVVHDLVRTVDIFPTVLDYLGISEPSPIAGRSLRPLMKGTSQEGRVALADQINGFDMNAKMVEKRPLDDFLYMAMDREWKLVYRPANPIHSELYNLERDPGETENLFTTEPAQAQRLLEILAREEPWVTEPFLADEHAGDPEAARQALEALGYLGGSSSGSSILNWAWACPENLERLQGERRQGDCQTPRVPVLPRRTEGQ